MCLNAFHDLPCEMNNSSGEQRNERCPYNYTNIQEVLQSETKLDSPPKMIQWINMNQQKMIEFEDS